MAMNTDHRALAGGYFNGAWDLIDASSRTPAQDRDMLTIACASRQHWIEAGGTAENLVVADWQVAHAASLAGFGEVALAFAGAAVDRAEAAGLAPWLIASAHEGLARACAASGDRLGFEREAQLTRTLLNDVTDPENRELVETQLDSINPPA
jgi:hypothetical protein